MKSCTIFSIFIMVFLVAETIKADTFHYQIVRRICPTRFYHDPLKDRCRRTPGGGNLIKYNFDAKCFHGYRGLLAHSKKSRYYFYCGNDAVLSCMCPSDEQFSRLRLRCEKVKKYLPRYEQRSHRVVENIIQKYKCLAQSEERVSGRNHILTTYSPATEKYFHTFPTFPRYFFSEEESTTTVIPSTIKFMTFDEQFWTTRPQLDLLSTTLRSMVLNSVLNNFEKSFTTNSESDQENLKELSTKQSTMVTMKPMARKFQEETTTPKEIESFSTTTTIAEAESLSKLTTTEATFLQKSIDKQGDESTTTIPPETVDRVLNEFVRRKTDNETISMDVANLTLKNLQETFPETFPANKTFDYDFEDVNAKTENRKKFVEYYEVFQYYYDDSPNVTLWEQEGNNTDTVEVRDLEDESTTERRRSTRRKPEDLLLETTTDVESTTMSFHETQTLRKEYSTFAFPQPENLVSLTTTLIPSLDSLPLSNFQIVSSDEVFENALMDTSTLTDIETSTLRSSAPAADQTTVNDFDTRGDRQTTIETSTLGSSDPAADQTTVNDFDTRGDHQTTIETSTLGSSDPAADQTTVNDFDTRGDHQTTIETSTLGSSDPAADQTTVNDFDTRGDHQTTSILTRPTTDFDPLTTMIFETTSDAFETTSLNVELGTTITEGSKTLTTTLGDFTTELSMTISEQTENNLFSGRISNDNVDSTTTEPALTTTEIYDTTADDFGRIFPETTTLENSSPGNSTTTEPETSPGTSTIQSKDIDDDTGTTIFDASFSEYTTNGITTTSMPLDLSTNHRKLGSNEDDFDATTLSTVAKADVTDKVEERRDTVSTEETTNDYATATAHNILDSEMNAIMTNSESGNQQARSLADMLSKPDKDIEYDYEWFEEVPHSLDDQNRKELRDNSAEYYVESISASREFRKHFKIIRKDVDRL